MAERPAPPALSVVIATRHRWPTIARTLDSVWDQAVAVNAEVVVADGHGAGLPADFGARYPGARRLDRQGASVFVLRAMGILQATGDVVAITEDHCIVDPQWCAKLIDTHRRYPSAAAVGGAVDNGSSERLIDWANYFVAHSPLMAPIAGGEARMLCGQAGVALKRRVIPAAFPSHGLCEMLFLRALRARGEILIANPDIIVRHVQSHGFWNTFAVHFHNGRTIAGFRAATLGRWGQMIRVAASAILPALLVARAAKAVLAKRRCIGQFVLSLPLTITLACCHAAGEMVGHWAGAGTSPERLS